MKRLLLLLAILFISALAHAQQGNTLTIRYVGVPTGTCGPFFLAVNNATSDEYNCTAGGTWHLIGGGGSGNLTGTLTSPKLPEATGAHTLGDSPVSDAGTSNIQLGTTQSDDGQPVADTAVNITRLSSVGPDSYAVGLQSNVYTGALANSIYGQLEVTSSVAGAVASSANSINADVIVRAGNAATLVDQVNAFYTDFSIDGPGGVTEGNNILINGISTIASGTVTNAYGLHVHKMDEGDPGATNTFAIGIDDQGATRFAIKVLGGKTDFGPQTTTVGNLIDSGLSASLPVVTDSSKQLASGTVTGTGAFVLATSPTFITGLTSPVVTTSGSNGGLTITEGTGAGLTPASGTDVCWGDSTAHRFKCNNNNAGGILLSGIASAGTVNHGVKLAANGIDLVDIGAVFAASATTDTTSATNITSGTLPKAQGGSGGTQGALSIIQFQPTASISNTTTQFIPMGTGVLSSGENQANAPVPLAGTISHCYVIYGSGAALTGSMSVTWNLRKNLAACGSPGTVSMVVNSGSSLQTTTNNPIANDTTNTCTVAVGDAIDIQSVPANTPTGGGYKVSCQLQP